MINKIATVTSRKSLILKADLIWSQPSIGVVRPPPKITVTITIIMVADTIICRGSVDVFLMAKANAMAPLNPV